MGQCDFSQWHPSYASFFENDAKHGDDGGAHRFVQNAILSKNLDRVVTISNLIKMKQELDPSEAEHFQKKRLIFIC